LEKEEMEYKISKKRAVLWVVTTVLGPLLFYGIASSLYIGMWYFRTGYHGPPIPKIILEAMFIGYPPAIWGTVVFWWLMHRKKTTFRNLFLTQNSAIIPDIGIGIGLGVLWIIFYGLADVVSWQAMINFDFTKLMSIPTSLSAGFGEEFLYRGFLFWLLAAAGTGKGSRLIITSIAFGLGHCLWGPWGMVWTTILGFSFGLSVLWRGNAWPAVVAHTLLNLFIEPGLIEKALTGGFNT
jgi:membrane protease YdiL (CAAX protease family)